ncbi:3'-5' exoribonuclease HELZ2-like [Engraulis encrasicolus]|uniref:3'-5' exoribonuclease HELZ2-like n=1 Tax=Engraulis encrasicolus TaxID=184585 RepID=UPI002FD08259
MDSDEEDDQDNMMHYLLTSNPNKYKRCKLVVERHDRGYAMPFDEPNEHIAISGRDNLCRAFPGETVCVEILTREDQMRTGKVVGVMERGRSLPAFICKMVEGSPHLVTPITKPTTWIRVIHSKTSNSVQVHQYTDEGKWLRKENVNISPSDLYLVQVLKWKKTCFYPLGVVTKVLSPDDVHVQDEIKEALDAEYGLIDQPPSFRERQDGFVDPVRENLCDCLTFTIDSASAKDLDDAISVIDQGDTFQIGVHITDVAAIVPKGSDVDDFAKNQGETFYGQDDEPCYMFPHNLRESYLSLREGQTRKAISLLVSVNKQTYRIVKHSLVLSQIISNHQLSYRDAEKMIPEEAARVLNCATVEDCVAVAYNFTEAHRESRLAGGVSRVQRDGDRSHRMVEELMNMYGSAVADQLLASDSTKTLTPLRCHRPPELDHLKEFRRKYQALIPLSPFLSQIILILENNNNDSASESENYTSGEEHSDESDQDQDDDQDDVNIQNPGTLPMQFEVFNAVLKKLDEAIDSNNHLIVKQLMSSDDIHPTLIPLQRAFKELLSPAVTLRSCSTLESRMGHFDLQLDAYCRASAPMRRYVDIVLQRLLHRVLGGEACNVSYTLKEIEQLCAMNDSDRASDYQLQLKMFTQFVKKQHVAHMAVLGKLLPKGDSFSITFPLTLQLQDLSVMYRHLKVVEQPKYNKERHTITLQWKRRVYSFTKPEKNPVKTLGSRYSTCVAVEQWQKMMMAVQNQNWAEGKQILQNIMSHLGHGRNEENDEDTNQGHFKSFVLELSLGKVLPVQVGMGPGQTPEVHLINITREFEVCLEHSKRPTTCFSKLALHPSKSEYKNCEEYQEIWGCLCEMDTAHNALEENNSVILEGVQITWISGNHNGHRGYFRISQAQKKQWALEFDVTNCFLCIRLRDQNAETENEESDHEEFEDLLLQDKLPFTWVAHGVTSRPKKKKKDTKKETKEDLNQSPTQIDFYINHCSMNYTPDQVYVKNTKFTVEVIPKKIPYVLRENAVEKLKRANSLVQDIAVGHASIHSSIEDEMTGTLATDGKKLGLPPLNNSQKEAIEQALHRKFTLIQGPPGTGKTVVGVHIVYHFFQKNREHQSTSSKSLLKEKENSGKSPPKKRAILYCGPSNKSVDIVAEQLLKLQEKVGLKPVRVYSEQMEMLEFPYPGSELKLCKQSLREDKLKGKLKSISLMHRIRDSSNPFSGEIEKFDVKIKTRALMESDIAEYKEAIKNAKIHELPKHDVVLCTCAAALNPILIKTMDFCQILIDECAMATEPEAFIPLVSHSPKKIVLLGDHKQLRPIVECAAVKEMGMKQSLFERYMDKALMLDTQYRMHEDICAFPSEMFYEGRLKTGATRGQGYLLTGNRTRTPILFGHIQATEDSLVVSTTTGNENSKSNPEEAAQAVRIAKLLIKQSKVSPEDIAILTPYNAQVVRLNQKLKEEKIENVTVCTIMKSQGSEWPYVIFSTVRSCKPSELRARPSSSKSWQAEHLGFITDPNQVNVAITRAQDGLCILGNRDLLRCNQLWNKLLAHYEKKGCVVDPAKVIQVHKK